MPRGDRTGPMGMGPMTGRAAGYCAGYGVPGYANPIPGRGYGMGWGGGWGRGWRWRHWYYATGLPGWARFGYAPAYGPYAPPTREQEAEMLKEQAEWLKGQLDAISKRIAELEQEK
ncbi:MAG: DUF5320 domain-containing protein [Anaerolineae bacterium]|nr:DUF5320 domain-containing protein [Anaerolineae bacterium]